MNKIMSHKKTIAIVLSLVAIATFLTGCEESPPPKPENALNVNAELKIKSQDKKTGDVTVDYTLYIKNKTDKTLEKVILKDFKLPEEIEMEKERFEIENLKSGEVKDLNFEVIVKGWGKNPRDEKWEVDFTARIEKGNAYTEQDVFYYGVHLYPSEG